MVFVRYPERFSYIRSIGRDNMRIRHERDFQTIAGYIPERIHIGMNQTGQGLAELFKSLGEFHEKRK